MNPSTRSRRQLHSRGKSKRTDAKRGHIVEPEALSEFSPPTPDEVTIDGNPIAPRDPNFDSELEYDGYDDIEKFDNDEYESDVEEEEGDSTRALKFKDRPTDEEADPAEEDVTDKQDNQKSGN